MACVIQMIAEVLFYETSECAIVNYFIPDLARTEVQGVTYAIHQAIQSMFSSMSETNVPILDAPRYLFLSTRLAERFPDLLESVIVRSYHSHLPGELSQKWKISHGTTFVSPERGEIRVRSYARRMTFTGLLVALLQYLGSVSISVQRFFIHAIQPVIMAGVAAMIGLILSNPWYVLIFVPVLVYCLYHLWDRAHANEADGSDDGIAPMPDDLAHKTTSHPPLEPQDTTSELVPSLEIDHPSIRCLHSIDIGSCDDSSSGFDDDPYDSRDVPLVDDSVNDEEFSYSSESIPLRHRDLSSDEVDISSLHPSSSDSEDD